MFLSAILAGFLLVSCNKEQGYTGFVDPDAGKNAEISLSTDKAAYAPGETIKCTASQMPSRKIHQYQQTNCHIHPLPPPGREPRRAGRHGNLLDLDRP